MTRFFINLILPLIGFLISIYIRLATEKSGYENYFWIPLLFSLYLLLDKSIYERAFNNVGYAIFFLSGCFRFFITPFIACTANYPILFGIIPTASELSKAIFILIYEEISIFILLFILKRKFYRTNDIQRTVTYTNRIGYKTFFVLIIILAIFVIVAIPESIANIHFAANLEDMDLGKTVIMNKLFAGLFTEIITLGRLFAVLLIIDYCYKQSRKGNIKITIIISVIAILLNASFVTNLSRFGIIVPIISFTYLLINLYHKQKKLILNAMLSIIISAVVMMSAIKFFSEDRNSGQYKSNDIEFWGETLQTYFMGVKETAVGIHAENKIESIYNNNKILLSFNDTFANVIGLSNFTTSSINTVHLYNYFYFPSSLAVSQIPPNIINGLYYFGWIGAPLYTLFFVLMFSYLDYKARSTSQFVLKFALLYGALYCGLCMMINGSMLISFLINDTLIIILYSKINYLFANKYYPR